MKLETEKQPGVRRIRLYLKHNGGGYIGFFSFSVTRGWDYERLLQFYLTRKFASSGAGLRSGRELLYFDLFATALSIWPLRSYDYSYEEVVERRWRKLVVRTDKI